MRRVLMITTLIVAGELVFSLPFHTARFFRPTLLEVFGLSNTQLGDLFALYGILAMLAYFPGGALADRYSARTLLTLSLVATALGGLYMATIPSPAGLGVLYAYWGITTIFLFWGALIRATRDWGGATEQGMAFGVLEAGRGVVAATVAAAMVVFFAGALPDDVAAMTREERRAGMQLVILLYAAVTFAAALMTWCLVPVPEYRRNMTPRPLHGMVVVLKQKVVWAQAAIIVCAYCAFKGLDNYSLYAVQVLGMDEVAAARFATWGAYSRPFAALLAGFLADRFRASRVIVAGFVLTTATAAPLSVLAPDGRANLLIMGNLFASFFAVFALRAVYFALLEENRTPLKYTGAAVGLVSLVGFTPEIFFAPIAGRILDATPGLGGHQDYFSFLAAIAAAGIACALWLIWLQKRDALSAWPDAQKPKRSLYSASSGD